MLKDKNSHKRKLKMARRMMTKYSSGPFSSSFWNERKDDIADRVRRNIIAVQLRKAERLKTV
jgi:hypothetical protein